MRQLGKYLLLAVISAAHAFAFLRVWSVFGADAMFAVLTATDSYVASMVAASTATAAIATSPLAFLAGLLGGRSLVAPAVLLLLVGWMAFLFLFGDLRALSLVSELAAMAVVGATFYLLGSARLRSRPTA